MYDVWAVANAELALVFAALTLVGGMTYSRPTLNTWWTWDAKLTLTALMFALLVGYFVVRGLIDDPERRGRVSAGRQHHRAGELAFQLPGSGVVSHPAPGEKPRIRWQRRYHGRLDGAGAAHQRGGGGAFVYLYFMLERVRIGRLEAGVSDAHDARSAGTAQDSGQEVVHV